MVIWLYFKAVGKHWWTLMSCAAFTILGTYGIHAKKTDQWIVNSTFAMAAVFLLIGCFLAWIDLHKLLIAEKLRGDQLEAKLAAIPLKLSITVEDFFRRASFETHAHLNFDFFLYICIRLLAPSSITVEYALEVIAPTSALPSSQVLDMNSWAKTKFVEPDPFGTTAPPILYALPPLPTLLELGHPVNGWLHFRTTGLPDSELLKCRLRLLAKSSHGTEFFDVDLKSRPFFRKDFKIVLVKDEEAYLQRSSTNPLPPTV
jgi:hypothetical protein